MWKDALTFIFSYIYITGWITKETFHKFYGETGYFRRNRSKDEKCKFKQVEKYHPLYFPMLQSLILHLYSVAWGGIILNSKQVIMQSSGDKLNGYFLSTSRFCTVTIVVNNAHYFSSGTLSTVASPASLSLVRRLNCSFQRGFEGYALIFERFRYWSIDNSFEYVIKKTFLLCTTCVLYCLYVQFGRGRPMYVVCASKISV